MLSAMVSASVWRRSISCWPGEPSWWENSVTMPMYSSAETAMRRSFGASLRLAWSK